jgi:hypothetical protein
MHQALEALQGLFFGIIPSCQSRSARDLAAPFRGKRRRPFGFIGFLAAP